MDDNSNREHDDALEEWVQRPSIRRQIEEVKDGGNE